MHLQSISFYILRCNIQTSTDWSIRKSIKTRLPVEGGAVVGVEVVKGAAVGGTVVRGAVVEVEVVGGTIVRVGTMIDTLAE